MTDKELSDAALLEFAAIEHGSATIKLVAGDLLIGNVHFRSRNGRVCATPRVRD
jgi:hypothetical protein